MEGENTNSKKLLNDAIDEVPQTIQEGN